MCGIAGVIRLDGSGVDQAVLDNLVRAQSHRGPDGNGTFIDGAVGLGHNRLAIIDVSNLASQPMTSADGRYTLVFNGEIYNFREKREELQAKGYHFTSQSDTEVLLYLYAEYAEQCVDHLRGMFAFAVYDKERQTVFIARDRAGQKPVKYFQAGGVFAFASELKALRTVPQCPQGADWEAIHHFLTMMYVPAPATGIEGIKKLAAGSALTIDVRNKIVNQRQYWSLQYQPDEAVTEDEWQHRVADSLDECVRMQMVSDVPVGAFLSGGIDSAAVVAYMQKYSDSPVQTFSIGSDNPKYDETEEAQATSAALGTSHHPIPLEADIVSLLPDLVRAYEEPYADASAIPTYLVSQFTRQSVTVALNGDGGDENFAGYVRYPIARFSERWAAFPAPLHYLVQGGTNVLHAVLNNTFSYRCRRFQQSIHQPFAQRYLQYLSYFTDEEKQALYRPDFAGSFAATSQWYADRTSDARQSGYSTVEQAMAMDLQTYLADDLLPKVDLGAMAHSLEARSPFLDHVFMEMTATIPVRYKLNGSVRKYILKQALRDVLPTVVLDRKKRGFRLPLDTWFRGNARPFVEERLRRGDSRLQLIFDEKKLNGFVDNYYKNGVDFSDYIWALLWLDEWLLQYT